MMHFSEDSINMTEVQSHRHHTHAHTDTPSPSEREHKRGQTSPAKPRKTHTTRPTTLASHLRNIIHYMQGENLSGAHDHQLPHCKRTKRKEDISAG